MDHGIKEHTGIPSTASAAVYVACGSSEEDVYCWCSGQSVTKALCGEQLDAWGRAERYTHSVRGGWRVGGGGASYLGRGKAFISCREGERCRKRKCLTVCLERTRKSPPQSDEHWKHLAGNAGENSETQGGRSVCICTTFPNFARETVPSYRLSLAHTHSLELK